MKSCCEGKRKVRSEEEKRALNARVNRVVGQMNGVKKMLEEDRYCGDILIQLAAIERSVKSLSRVILEKHMRSCLVEDVQKGDLSAVDELVELFKRF